MHLLQTPSLKMLQSHDLPNWQSLLLYVLLEGEGKFTARLTNTAAGRACLSLKNWPQ